MKSMGDMLLNPESFSEIVMGNTALVRGMVEAGVKVAASYPGSPTPEIATAIASIPKDKRPFYFEFSTNEKVASEVAFGASVNGNLSCAFFKSVGLNVASDTVVQFSLMELIGGLVLVLGDDPGANSSQNEQDNRHFAAMAYIPVLEPANPRETYEMFLSACRLSKEKHMPVILRMTTHVCHAKMKVRFGRIPDAVRNEPFRNVFSPENGPYIPITTTVFPKKRKALEKLAAAAGHEEMTRHNRLYPAEAGRSVEVGMIASGLPFLSLKEVASELPVKVDLLKLGMIHPLDEKRILDFLRSHRKVYVVEELDRFLETAVKTLAYDNGLSARDVEIRGKPDLESLLGEYTPDKIRLVLDADFPGLKDLSEAKKAAAATAGTEIAPRPPQMCPGCGHRSAFHAIKQALAGDDVTVADIGCHTLGAFPPYNVGQVLLCMGHSTGTGAGLSIGNDKPVIAFLGDSTLFHAGLPGIVNALFNAHDLILIVMENGTTAMTGHQNHPATGGNFNDPVDKIPIRRLLEGLGVKSLDDVDTYDQEKLKNLVLEARKKKGLKVIIARHPCMLKFTRDASRKPNYRKRSVSVDGETCTLRLNCIKDFACPTFQWTDDGRVQTHKDLCIGDGSCMPTCPTQAIRPDKP